MHLRHTTDSQLDTSDSIRGANEFDSKAKIEEHIRNLDIPATFVFAGFYMSLFEPGQYLTRSREVEGNLKLELPVSAENSQFPLIDTPRDFGKFVISAMLKRDSLLGANVYAAEGYYTLNQIADIVNGLEPSAGQRCYVKELSDEEFLGSKPHSGTDAQEREMERLSMYQFLRQFGYYGGASLDSSHKVSILQMQKLSGIDNGVFSRSSINLSGRLKSLSDQPRVSTVICGSRLHSVPT